jgi:aryl-alcohol dehydrogenase-like predicted oxidoreductase
MHYIGDTSRGFSQRALGDQAAQPFFQQAMELGITFWNTANVYGIGSSEGDHRDVELTEDEVRMLEEHYVPHLPTGFS